MIKNERQYRITKAAARRFADSLRQEAKVPSSVDPIVARAAAEAAASQLAELEAQIAEYESLKSGRLEVAEADSLASLAEMFIKARIAAGLSQKELATRLGLKEQQIQRYEETNYGGASLARLSEVADALGISVRHQAVLGASPEHVERLMKRLETTGLHRDFLVRRFASNNVVPFAKSDSPASSRLLSDVLARAKRVFGWSPDDLLGTGALEIGVVAAGGARFKVKARRNLDRVNAYAVYAHYLALQVLRATDHLPRVPLPTTAQDFYDNVCLSYSEMNFENAVRYIWSLGIAVLPLDDEGAFDGAYWRVGGRHVIVLKQNSTSPSRWLFDLLHDYRHAVQHPDLSENEIVEAPATSQERRESPDELDASAFAGDVALAGHAEELIKACERATGGRLQRLKAVLPAVAKDIGVDLASAANFMAYQLSLNGENWWGAAANLQAEGEKPWLVARDVLLEHIKFEGLAGPDQELLRDALTERTDLS